MEEEGLTEPNLQLDDPEKLFRASVRESFSWWRPRALPRFSGPCINNLVTYRWHGRSRIPELELIRRVQARQGMAYDELLARYHRKVLKVADGHMPRYWRARRSSLRDKHTNTLFYEDLVAAGVAAMWRAALKFDLTTGYAFWTAAGLPVTGAISDEARWWRRGRGGSGETQLDRWLYTHPNATPGQVLERQGQLYKRPVFHSLEEAAEGIKQFWARGGDFEFDCDDEMVVAGHPLRVMYGFFDPYQLSPHRRVHDRFSALVDRLSGGLDTGPDVGEVSRPKTPFNLYDERRKAAAGYRIPVTPELETQAQQDLEFANQRWQRRMRRGPMPAKQYPRWSTIGEKDVRSTRINKSFPLMSRSHNSDGMLNIGMLRETFYRYWNLPRGIASNRSHARFVTHRARIMSRDYHYHHDEFELWVVGPPPWKYDLRTPEQNRERQKRDWNKKDVRRNLQNFAADSNVRFRGVKRTLNGCGAMSAYDPKRTLRLRDP